MDFFDSVERAVVVRDRVPLARSVVGIDLASPNGRDLPAWTPGSHVDVLLGGGVERQYSLCGDLDDRSTWRIAVLLEESGRGGSAALHERAQPGARLTVRGPRNHFPFTAPEGGRCVLVAGGIGITPMRAMITAAERADVDWSLEYAGRSRETMAFAADLLAEHPDRVRLHAADEGGRLDLDALFASLGEGDAVYACGPRRLLDAVETAGAALPADSVRVERFEAKEYGDPVWLEPFEVEFAQSGVTAEVPLGRSILEVAEENDVVIVASCRTGTCGTCETVVLEGEVEHRDSVLTPSEREHGDTMMVCVSRAACPRLVLDA